MTKETDERQKLLAEVKELRIKLEEAEEMLRAIRSGEVDAVIVSSPLGEQVFMLKGEEHAYRVLVETMNEGAATLAADGTILYCNSNLAAIVKTPMEKLTGTPFRSLITPSSLPLFEELFRKSLRSSGKGELILMAGDGTNVPVYFSASTMKSDDTSIVCAVVTDLTRQKRDEAIIASGRLASAILEQAGEAILVCDETGHIIRYSQMAQQVLGITALQQHFDELLPLRKVTDGQLLSISGTLRGDIQQNVEVSLDREDRKKLAFLLNSMPLRSTEGGIIGAVSTLFDITERRQAEEALRESETKYRNLTESLDELIYRANPETFVASFVNRAIEGLYGYTVEEWLKDPALWENAIHPDDKERVFAGLAEAQVKKEPYTHEYRIVRKDKTMCWVRDHISWEKDQQGNPVSIDGVVYDITESRKMDEDHQRAAKLESIGTLAGGIAHDFNNILTGIFGNIQMANAYLKQNKADTAEEMLAEAEKASLRAKDLTQQLLTFSRGGAPVKKVMLINQLIKESTTFALRGSNVKPEFAIPENLWAVEADKGQLNQVINNLVLNADHAMPNGGIINVTASNVVTKKQHTLPLPDGRYIEIAIKDHGIGIPEGNKDRIFELYFTTKQKGSGLGLATSYSIIKNHGGYITFESELGVGTTFRVYLPATKEKIEKEPEELPTQPLPLTQGRILVMDDEDMIRIFLGRMLKGAGYEVELTKDGAEAIQKYTEAKESGKPFDAVILDLTIPGGIGGKEVMLKLLEIDPGVKAIVSSGYATDPIMADHKKYRFSGVVTKPYNIREMEQTLNSLLTQKGEG